MKISEFFKNKFIKNGVIQMLGQSLASYNKIKCIELPFVKCAESKLHSFALQTFQKPYSTRFKLVASKMKIVDV